MIHASTLIFLQVTLKGPQDCVEAARSKIEELVLDQEAQVSIECCIEQVHVTFYWFIYLMRQFFLLMFKDFLMQLITKACKCDLKV